MTSTSHAHTRGRKVVLLHHPRIPAALALARDLVDPLARRGLTAEIRSVSRWSVGETEADRLACVVTLGGDGTVLRAVRQTAACGVPVVGVNFGRLGFLAEMKPEDAPTRLPGLIDGGGYTEERLMLRCVVPSASDGTVELDAVNDVFVGRGRSVHTIALEVTVNQEPLARFVADGVLVATPTGSTAYSLSAGGPIVAPGLDALVVTAVAAHPMAVWPIVVPATATIGVVVRRSDDAVVAVDGHDQRSIGPERPLLVRVSPVRARFLLPGPPDAYYRTLFERLRS